MNRLNLVKSQVKKHEAEFYNFRKEMNSAKFKWDNSLKELERLEAHLICDQCKGVIKKGDPYISDRHYNYCTLDCQSAHDVAEVDGLNRLENQRQLGNLK